jgi:hypothetical protein
MKFIALWGLIAIAASVLAGVLASYKNRDYSTWMAWTFLVPPALLVLLVLPRNAGSKPRRPTLDEEDRANESL